MKKILISAFIGSRNLGDKAIFKSLLDNLELNKKQVVAVTINEELTRQDGVGTVFAKDPRNIVRAIKECDVFLVGGGGIIQDKSSLFNFLYYAFQLWVAKYYKRPTILVYVGIGPLKHSLSRMLLKYLAPSLELAVVRDEKSRDVLSRYIDDPKKIITVHDSVLSFVFDEKKLPLSPYENKKPYVVVSLRRWFFTMSLLPVFIARKVNRLPALRRKYETFMNNVAQDLDTFLERNKDMSLVFAPFDTKEDVEVLNDLKSRMQHQDRVTLTKDELSEEEYLSIVKQAEFLIGMRLHSLILAANVSKPFVALSYSPKVDEFTEQMQLTDYATHVERYNSEQLQKNLAAMHSKAPQLAKKMPGMLVQYRKDNQEAFDELKQKIKTYSEES